MDSLQTSQYFNQHPAFFGRQPNSDGFGPWPAQSCPRQMKTRDRSSRGLGVGPYCCPGSNQQPKILYHLLSRQVKERLDTSADVHRSGSFTSSTASEYVRRCGGRYVGEHQAGGPDGYADLATFTTGPPDYQFSNQRPRSQSMGSTCGWNNAYEVSPTLSRDSLTSYDSFSDESLRNNHAGGGRTSSPTPSQSDALEVMRNRLMGLVTRDQTASSASLSPLSGDDLAGDVRSLSQPGSPPLRQPYPSEVHRKYSEGSQVYLKMKLQALRLSSLGSAPCDGNGVSNVPVDLSCKRRKFERGVLFETTTMANGFRKRTYTCPIKENRTLSTSIDEGIEDDSSCDHSILKLVLTGRGRSNSLSIGTERRRTAAGLDSFPGRGGTAGAVWDPRGQQGVRVALAKKNLLPVMARVTDNLNRTIVFARSQPEFSDLPASDQTALLVHACPRLLLLYMAETNLQFVVAPIHEDDVPPLIAEDDASSQQPAGLMPTMQFVDLIQNFIRKCQAFNITASEYFYMRMITLFHTGMLLLRGKSHRRDFSIVCIVWVKQMRKLHCRTLPYSYWYIFQKVLP